MFAKLFERILLNQFNEFIQKKIERCTVGFPKHKSSTDAVLLLIEALQEDYDNLKISVAVFIDLAKAFNSISHEIFLKKERTVFKTCSEVGLPWEVTLLLSYGVSRL